MATACPVIVWLRNDLRLQDNPALDAAVARGGPVVPVYLWSPAEDEPWSPGSASRWWLHHSLHALSRRLARCGSRLVIRRGPSPETLLELLRQTRAEAVVWNRRYDPAGLACDARVESALREAGATVTTFPGRLLFEPTALLNQQHHPFQVFSAYWRACRGRGGKGPLRGATVPPKPERPLAAPRDLPPPAAWPAGVAIDELDLLPRNDWAAGLRDAWTPGEQGAQRRLAQFLDAALGDYASDRDRPDLVGTSRLSPHLHFGEISPREVWHAVVAVSGNPDDLVDGSAAEVFLRELGWREFAHYLLYHFPHTPHAPLKPPFAGFPWRRDQAALRAWQRGRTGYPMVDAGMRELWSTGWMHNRVRMIVGSFLVKHLLLDWRAGASWFWDTLVDADLANNTLGWQWVAGCGADAAPYFRIFNPVLQGRKFDPAGDYVRRWVPELARLPSAHLHAPWEAPSHVLAAAGVELGVSYPRPIIDHALARERALQALEKVQVSDRKC